MDFSGELFSQKDSIIGFWKDPKYASDEDRKWSTYVYVYIYIYIYIYILYIYIFIFVYTYLIYLLIFDKWNT